MTTFLLTYYGMDEFEFRGELDEYYLSGSFIWNPQILERMSRITEIIERENEFWYLDQNGNRLEDKELFTKSPWSIIIKQKEHKIIQRYIDYETGEAKFALQPWLRIGELFK